MARWIPRRPRPKLGESKQARRGPHPWLWRLRGMPLANGSPTNFQLHDAQAIAEHLEKTGLVDAADLAKLANEDGHIHVDQLPVQQIKQLPPEVGPDVWTNPYGKWVGMDVEEPPKREAPDLSGLSDEEAELVRLDQEAIAEALRKRQELIERMNQADPHVRNNNEKQEREQ